MSNQEEDALLVQRAQHNPREFEKLYDKYHENVYSYFWYRNGHDKEIAEDLMQETFVKAFNKLSQFQVRRFSYLTYLLKIAHNLLANYFRDNRPTESIELKEVPTHIQQHLNSTIDASIMWKDIQKLPLLEKEVILLYYRREMPIVKISHIIGKSQNAVKLILSRARKRLRAQYQLQSLAKLPDKPKRYSAPHFRTNLKP